ncbi:MAG: ABC transporter permease [Bacillus sp. (in: Bacteria)]|nr:ABC transporter permease [Bacillus sp. (in: firmicutes)]MCM1427622.1 ABC transporter permease [Eubacterium sp.]
MGKNTISTLAVSRIKYNRSRTLLTAVSIALTTILLTAVATSALGLFHLNKMQAQEESNIHATLRELDAKQVEMLKNHMDVEAAEMTEIFATVEYDKMNGYLSYSADIKEGIYHQYGNLLEGHAPERVDEICGSAAFFERMGVEPVIGNKITISFRPNGKGVIETREFTICGLLSQADMSDLHVSDSYISYGAYVSEALIEEFLTPEEREYRANIRVYGETELNYNEIIAKVSQVAQDIGCKEDNVNPNKYYLSVMTDPGTETIGIAGGIALMVIVFSGLVIYSIYYVSVITDVQEIGKLKALGATKKQVKRLLVQEGMRVAAFAIPAGIIVGFLLPYFIFPLIFKAAAKTALKGEPSGRVSMFSLPLLLLVAAAVLFAVYLSLLKPVKMAAKISPIEAIRYQEGNSGKKIRKGKKEVNVFALSAANLVRNKKRTVVTMVTMGLSCVLFMSLACVLGSMREEDMARRNIPAGDFRLSLDYSANDKEYPENNLDMLQQQDIFGKELMENLENIDGVQKIAKEHKALISSEYPSELFEENRRTTMGVMDEEKAKEYGKITERGEIDYDTMAAQCGALFTSDYYFDEYGFTIGDIIPLTVYDGDRQIDFSVKIMATMDDGFLPFIMIPQKVWDELGMQFDSTTDLYISVDENKYDSVKESLQKIAEAGEHFILYSMDEEMEFGKMSVALIKYPMYGILVMIAVIGFINLINTMITSIVTRKRELGILQAVGLSDRQLTRMLAGEGMVFTAGTLIIALVLGNLLGYLVFLWAKDQGFMSISAYHYPLVETILLILALVLGQLGITAYISKRVHKESLIDRIRSGE